jgi:hypothetical protein
MQPYQDRRLTLAALNMAIEARRPAPGALVHHSDRGVQYACDDYRSALADAEITASVSRTADCWDNAVVESFFSTLKHELVYRTTFANHHAARSALFQYIEGFYNRRRLHSSLGYLSPEEYERRNVTDQLTTCPPNRGNPSRAPLPSLSPLRGARANIRCEGEPPCQVPAPAVAGEGQGEGPGACSSSTPDLNPRPWSTVERGP